MESRNVLTAMITVMVIKLNGSTAAMAVWILRLPRTANLLLSRRAVKKRQKDISDIDQKIISMYAKGMTTRQISDTLEDIYGFEASEGLSFDTLIRNIRTFLLV